jgi:hypothetical protein
MGFCFCGHRAVTDFALKLRIVKNKDLTPFITPHSAGWSSPVPRLPAARRCTPQATAAAGSAAPRPGEAFEAYHPSLIGVICVMIVSKLWAVKPFF